MEQNTQADGQHPSVASACVFTHEHTDTRQKGTKENWLEASVIQWLLSILKGSTSGTTQNRCGGIHLSSQDWGGRGRRILQIRVQPSLSILYSGF